MSPLPNDRPTRVLIADDHTIFRAGLRKVLEAAGGLAVVAEAASGEEALARARETDPDLVVLDVSMPGRGGLETARELKRRAPKVRILVLTMHGEDTFAERCLREGADGYLTKDAPPEQLIQAVRRVSAGGKYVSPTLAERLAFSLEAGRQRRAHERLSPREFQVMRLIGAGKPVSAIAAELNLSVKTVSTYRARILEKMNMRTNAEIMRYAVELELDE